MDAPATRKQLTHDRILDTAARVLREDGFAGIGVADIMQRCGLTHGGFYAHFASRDALLADAVVRAGEDSCARLQQVVDAARAGGASGFEALVDHYLSEAHLKAPDRGCPVAALAAEMPRQTAAVREAGLAPIESLAALVQSTLDPALGPEAAAIVTAQLAGALQIARALGPNAKGRRQLAASRAFLLAQFGARGR